MHHVKNSKNPWCSRALVFYFLYFCMLISPQRQPYESSECFTTTALYKERFPKVCFYFTASLMMGILSRV